MLPESNNKSVISVAFHDGPFRLFLSILTIKSLLFVYFIYNSQLTSFGLLITFPPTFGVILFLLSISLFIKHKTSKLIYLFSLNFIISLLYISQSLYFRYFNDFASLYNLHQVSMLSSIVPIIIKMIGKEFFFIADLFFMPFIFPWFKKNYQVHTPSSRVRSFSLCLLLGIFLNIFPLYFFNLLSQDYFKSIFERQLLVCTLGVVNYQVFDIYTYLKTQTKKTHISERDRNLATDFFNQKNKEAQDNDFKGIGRGSNLLVIQVESLQHFLIGLKWKGNEVMPNLNRLLKEGIYFNQIYDQTWTGNTSDATFLANCSLYPSQSGALAFLYAQNAYYCLPKILGNQNYSSATMHAFRGSYWNRSVFEKALGFQRQFYEDKYLKEDLLGWGLSDKRFFAQSIEKIKALPSPFYALLTTLTSHVPFDDVTAEIDNFYLGDLEGKLIGNYLRSMHYVDSAIGEFLQKLSANNLMSKTIIAIYGDHRARFEENDLKLIGINNMDEIRKIPLILKIPDGNHGITVETFGGLIDFAPTISNILGLDISDTFFLGKDLFDRRDNFVIFRDGSFVNGDKHIDNDYVQKQLAISDLIVEKDLLRFINKQEKD